MKETDKEKQGVLYLVPTPIGNLGDITLRAIEVLKSVHLIGAEDTRHSALLLKHYEIETPMLSYHKFNEKSRLDKLISLLQSGKDIAVISDAGSPGISDPAALIVKEAIDNNITVCSLPGATALLPALISSGFDTGQFLFCGFLPRKESEKKKTLQSLSHLPYTLIFYEAPHRLLSFLKSLYEYLGDRNIVIARELTKKFEEYYRGRLSRFIEGFSEITLKGEITVVCEKAPQNLEISDEEIIENLKRYLSLGETKSFAVNRVSQEFNISKNRVYTLAHQAKNLDTKPDQAKVSKNK